MALPELLILSFTDARRDPRVYRQAKYLREHFSVTLCGLGNPELAGVRFLPVHRQPKNLFRQGLIALNLLLGNNGPALRRFVLSDPNARAHSFDLVLVNDLEPLPLGFALAQGAPVVFDAHEYYPGEFEGSVRWRLLFQRYYTKLCHDFMPRCAAVTTVAPGIAGAYAEHFSILPDVVYNTPEYQDLPVRIRTDDKIRLIHHGVANPERGIELMLDMMRHVDARFSLDMMMVGSQGYIESLKRRSADIKTICWRNPVPMPEICRTINEYDLGMFLLKPSSLSYKFALPNKFFEFIQARLGIAVGPSPEMATIVNEHGLGVVAESFTPEALASRLNALSTADVLAFKKNSNRVSSLYSAEKTMETLEALLSNTVRCPSSG